VDVGTRVGRAYCWDARHNTNPPSEQRNPLRHDAITSLSPRFRSLGKPRDTWSRWI